MRRPRLLLLKLTNSAVSPAARCRARVRSHSRSGPRADVERYRNRRLEQRRERAILEMQFSLPRIESCTPKLCWIRLERSGLREVNGFGTVPLIEPCKRL